MGKRGLIPKPRSSFIKVRCKKCNNEQIIFDRCSTIVKCKVCDETLAEPTGGKAKINGDIVQVLG
jgi:small subunit ribosomal protein S27e